MECDCHRRLGPAPETPEQMSERVQRFVDRLQLDMLERERMCQMGDFNINITASGGHGCERKAKAGEKLYGRCGRFNCPDCMAYEFVQQLKQRGMFGNLISAKAEFTHWPGQASSVVDDMLTNERKSGSF
jgi:hypothetical protein